MVKELLRIVILRSEATKNLTRLDPSATSWPQDDKSLTPVCYPLPERGAILLIVLIVLLTISLLGASLMALFYNVLTSSKTELDRTRALYLAEAGIAKAISVLKSKADSTGGTNSQGPRQIIPPAQLGEGTYEVYNDFSQSVIISVGQSNGVKRTLQLKYNAF